jgi:SanA protein
MNQKAKPLQGKLRAVIPKIILVAIPLLLLAALTPSFLRVWVHSRVQANIYSSPDQAPPAGVALVFGAGLRADGLPTSVLHDRVATAAELYHTGKVKKLLMSGDNRYVNYNEPDAMRDLAISLGVPAEDVVPDYAGRRTYDSCYRAREIFGVEQAIVVTQQFHLDRALYLCRSLGVEAIGVAADRRAYRAAVQRWWRLRETAALVNAWLDIHLLQPVPVLGEKLPIEISKHID